jgi:guanylate kinase
MSINDIRKGNVIVITGPSGVGKGSIVTKILQQHLDIVLSVSATTRSKRPGEIDGVHYYFISKEEFQKLIDTDQMLEWAKFADNYYGTFKEAVQKETVRGNDVILEIEVQGAMQVKSKLPEAILIFISPPSVEELKARLVGRATETDEVVAKRLNIALKELQLVSEFNYNVINDDLDKAIEEVVRIILSKRKYRE